MKTAIVHDWLTDRGGAEKVLHNLLEIYPHAICTALSIS